MRLWTLHPKYLDPQGLVAVWREALLAQKVLAGKTRGYRFHPQLTRFRAQPDPLAAIATYLRDLHAEALQRDYSFDASKIRSAETVGPLKATCGQLLYEWSHLLRKLQTRSPTLYETHQAVKEPEAHPLFEITPGPIAEWERPHSAS